MIHLAGEQRLAFLGLLAVGDVDRDAADPRDPSGGIDARRRGPEAPADLAVGALDAELALRGLVVPEQPVRGMLHLLPVVRMDQRAHVLWRDRELIAIDAEDAVLAVVPQAIAGVVAPVP
jgi:hypothetical protein